MRELVLNEVFEISGGARQVYPSNWLITGSFGAFLGTTVFVATAFTPNPVSFVSALWIGTALGIGFPASYDLLSNAGL